MPWSRRSTAIPLLPLPGRTACTEPQCLYKGALYLFTLHADELEAMKGSPNHNDSNVPGVSNDLKKVYTLMRRGDGGNTFAEEGLH